VGHGIAAGLGHRSGALADLTKERARLEDEQSKLLHAHYAGAIPLDLLKKEQDRITAGLETIKNRIEAHHDEYADARNNLDDSLHLLEHAADIYARCDDANRRLCNQAFFTKIYIEEEGEVRADYARPFDALTSREVQADALTWAQTARNENEVRTPTEDGSSVKGSHLAHLGWLTGLEPATLGTTSRCSTD
jgi:site-specific DNA recombinase